MPVQLPEILVGGGGVGVGAIAVLSLPQAPANIAKRTTKLPLTMDTVVVPPLLRPKTYVSGSLKRAQLFLEKLAFQVFSYSLCHRLHILFATSLIHRVRPLDRPAFHQLHSGVTFVFISGAIKK